MNGNAVQNGTLHRVPLGEGESNIAVVLRAHLVVERGWGVAGERAASPITFDRTHAAPSGIPTDVPATMEADWWLEDGASLVASRLAGQTDIRTGSPSTVSWLINRHPLYGDSHPVVMVEAAFSYVAGYTPAPGESKAAANVSLHVLDAASREDLSGALLWWPSSELGNFSYDDFKGYSPPLEATVLI